MTAVAGGAHAHHHEHHVEPAELEPLGRYRTALLARITPLAPIAVGLLDAHGCVLAEDVAAPADVPGHVSSSMDGYAVRTGDGEDLSIAGEVAAGATPLQGALRSGTAVRIMTGGMVPEGADAVVPVELADESEGRVRLRVAPQPGANVRPAGQDVRAGVQVLPRGRRLSPADVGMLASVGHTTVLVHPRPRVAVISTGDEVVEPDGPLRPGAVRDANSYALTALARDAGGQATRFRVVRDNPAALREAFEGALASADALVTSGGVSAGRYDHVKGVLATLGDVRAVKVGMQPGMPQAFGFIGPEGVRIPCFGLPGNPVSAFVSFEVFVRPALRRLQGRRDLNRPRVTAALEEDVASPPHKVSFLRVRLRSEAGAWHVRLTGPQGSGILRSLVDADGLAEVPADRTSMDAGERVVVHLLGES